MPVIFQHRRGTTAELSTITGAEGELFVDTTKNTVVVMDGTTQGGTALATEAMISAQLGEIAISTVSVLKSSNLEPGSFIRTKGYYDSGDGGHADYLIMTPAEYGKTPDGYGDHTIANGNIAVLVVQHRANILQFGAFNDGVTDNYPAFRAAADSSIPLEFPGQGKFLLAYDHSKYSTPIIFKASVDFNNSTISITGVNSISPAQSGYILVLSTDSYGSWTSHNSTSALVTALKNDATVSGKYWSGLNDNAEFANTHLRINTTEEMYAYRDVTYTREELLVHTRDGQMTSALKYPLATSTISSVDVLPVSREYTVYENLTVNLEDADTTLSRYVTIKDASNIRVKNLNFIMDYSRIYSQSAAPVLLSIIDSCFVEIDGLYAGSPIKNVVNGNVTYGYVFSMGKVYDIKVKNAVAQGDGWGSSGNDQCRRVTIENCDLNRIDFHRPFYEYLNVKNCTLGNWGIKVTALGDLNIDSTTFNVDDAPFYPYRGIVSTRGDAGGWCDGHLYMNDCTIYNNSGVAVPLQRYESYNGVQDTQPSVTPVTFRNWESQTFSNIVVNAGEVIVGNFSNGKSYTVECDTIDARNIRCSNGAKLTIGGDGLDSGSSKLFSTDLTGYTNPRYYNAPVNRNISVRDCDVDSVALNHDTETCIMNVVIDNIRGNNGAGTDVNISQQGTYSITNSVLDSVSLSNSIEPIKATIENNVISAGGTTAPVGGISNAYYGGRGDDVLIKNNVIWVSSENAAVNNPYFSLLAGKCVDNVVTIEDSEPTTTYRPSWPNAGVVGIVSNFNYNNKVQFDVGPSGNQTPWTHADYKSADMSMPRVVGQSTFAPLDATNNATITMTASNQLTLDAGALNINALRYKL